MLDAGGPATLQQSIRAALIGGHISLIDSSFALDELAKAFPHQEAGTHFGKVGVAI